MIQTKPYLSLGLIVGVPKIRVRIGATQMSSIKDSSLKELGLRVLVIEDSVDTLQMLKLWLTAFGCEVFIAAESMAGVRMAIETKPDLIISDIGMPDVDGYELMRIVRKTEGLEKIPAIALTGYDRSDDKTLSAAAGYNGHLSKPTELKALLSLIKKLTGK
ncbi:MAG TPA: response regulator [Blastocatellia bacterium]|nr:response regulator [Blastocatellia bacterium]